MAALLSRIFNRSRSRERPAGHGELVVDDLADGRAPDATVDEVGSPADNVSFDGHTPIRSRTGNGHGQFGGFGGAF